MSSADDRTEKATPKRLADARKKGQLPRSHELSTALVVLAVSATLATQAGALARGASDLLRRYLEALPGSLGSLDASLGLAARLAGGALELLAPVFIAGFVAALVSPMVVGGWNLAPGAIKLDFTRLNPLAGIARLFSRNSLVELAKGVLKVTLIGAVGWALFEHDRPALLGLAREPAAAAIAHAATLALHALLWLAASLLVIAAVDVPWQLASHARQLRMTKQEVREEAQQSEGKPEVKSRIRQLQREFSRGRMLEAVPKADVVVTNPTHYAVALQYQAGQDRAPRVVAKGADLIALEIRTLAKSHRVPVVEAPPLARSLYRSCAVDAEIPGVLYQAVAQVLSYVYQLKAWRGGAAPAPPVIADDLPASEPDAPTG